MAQRVHVRRHAADANDALYLQNLQQQRFQILSRQLLLEVPDSQSHLCERGSAIARYFWEAQV